MRSVCVFAGSNAGVRDQYRAAADHLGRALAERGLTLVYGGAHVGLMGAIAAFIALPGGWGTWEEFFEVLTWAQLGLHRKPCGLLNVLGYFNPLLAFVDHSMAEGFVRREYRSMMCVDTSPTGLLVRLVTYTPPVVQKWIDREQT